MNTNALKQAEEYITAKLEEAKKKKATWEDLLSSAEAQKEQAAAETAKEYQNADPRAFHKAQDLFRAAQDASRMYSDKLKTIDAEPLITQEEYQSLHDDIFSALDAINQEAKQRICSIIDEEIRPIADDVAGAIADANDLLVTLQIDLLKDYRAEEIPSLQSKYTDHSIIGFLNMITASNLYQQKGEKE